MKLIFFMVYLLKIELTIFQLTEGHMEFCQILYDNIGGIFLKYLKRIKQISIFNKSYRHCQFGCAFDRLRDEPNGLC